MFELTPEWKLILTKAWSVRLMAIAAVLSAAELTLPLFRESVGGFWFALINLAVVAAAIFTRVLAQKDMENAGP